MCDHNQLILIYCLSSNILNYFLVEINLVFEENEEILF